MSHFTVLVIGSNWKEQLHPYWELDLSQDDMKKDIRAEFQDRTDELLEEYNTKGTEKVIMPDGRMLFPWDEEFKVLTESKKGFKSYKTVIPEGLEKREVPFKELYPSFDDFATEWHDYQKNDDGKYGYYCNPNAKWDWYSMGGRWSGFFRLKNGFPREGKLGDPGVFDNDPSEMGGGLRADQAKKGDIDFQGMREDHVKKCLEEYDEFHKIVNGREVPNWKKLSEEYKDDLDAAREIYNEDPVVKDLYDSKFFFDLEDYLVPRFEYAKRCQNEAITAYALVKDGIWYEKGQMGWWGISSNEKDPNEWSAEFTKILDELPDDALLTIVDCHI